MPTLFAWKVDGGKCGTEEAELIEWRNEALLSSIGLKLEFGKRTKQFWRNFNGRTEFGLDGQKNVSTAAGDKEP